MKEIYKLSYLNNGCLFFNNFLASEQISLEDFAKRKYKNQKITKHIKNRIMEFKPKDWSTFLKMFQEIGMKNDVIKEFFPLKYQWVIDNFGEINLDDYGYRSSEEKILWKVVESDKIFLKHLTNDEFKSHSRNLCDKFIEMFNKKYMQFGGFFLLEKENLITDKNIVNGKYKTYDYIPNNWIVF